MDTELFLQPIDGACGDHVIDALQAEGDTQFNSVHIVAAFAKKSGVSRLWDALSRFKDAGGEIEAFIGIDFDGTSLDAFELLYEVCDRLYVIHTSVSNQTFHPKLYVFRRPGTVLALVGSCNLTKGGLWENMEGFLRLELNLPADAGADKSVERILGHLRDTSREYIQLVDGDSMPGLREMLAPESKLQHKKPAKKKPTPESPADGDVTKLLFGAGPSAAAPPASTNMPSTASDEEIQDKLASVSGADVLTKELETGFWKKLTKFDVSPSSAPGQIIIPKRFIDAFPQVFLSIEKGTIC
jgi:HKD family nuclease